MKWDVQIWPVKIQIVPPVNIPIPTKIGSQPSIGFDPQPYILESPSCTQGVHWNSAGAVSLVCSKAIRQILTFRYEGGLLRSGETT